MIYIDLDGVLADFNKACIQYTGKSYHKECWSILEKVPNLFYNLDAMQDAKESMNELLFTYGYSNIQILTALPLQTEELVSAQVDKVQWVHENISSLLQVNCVPNWRFKKYFCKNTSDILIDDRYENCVEWESAGGKAIQHIDWKDTMIKLKEIV